MKSDTKAVYKRLHRVKIDEAANAVINILEEHDKRFPGTTIKKSVLLSRIPDMIKQMRQKNGIVYIPTVENREVTICDGHFVDNNWKEIRMTCEGFGYFIIWNPPHENLGIRLGTLDEYIRQQSLVMSIAAGFADFHNQRGEIIQKFGRRSTDLHVELSRHKEA